jgi:hypothetical protein
MKKKGMKKEVKGAPTVIRIKKAGWIYIALCIFMGVGAVNTANNLVYIIVALMLAFMAVSGIFGAADIKHMEVSFGFPDEIFAGRALLWKTEGGCFPHFLSGFISMTDQFFFHTWNRIPGLRNLPQCCLKNVASSGWSTFMSPLCFRSIFS